MNHLQIVESKRSPYVSFSTDGNLVITGRSIPEDAGKFFDPLLKWLCDYGVNPAPVTKLEISLEYFNSGSAKALLHVLKAVVVIQKEKGKQVHILWKYEKGDDDIKERGQYYSSILNCDFQFQEID